MFKAIITYRNIALKGQTKYHFFSVTNIGKYINFLSYITLIHINKVADNKSEFYIAIKLNP